ncbi:pectinesterase family protein [Marinomonas posidonica]|uniref:Pectinesterase n=1 Tax=Marinomonas posidonica (strain CECT 7376 / NCIMB 14433 / IVIA-Po-181) TaxID=491952 RepID=F6CZ55_MARPP|nr:pectinesterase family protein [Marinomonas posidonica]AEF53511.1 Pectinesterase [Marinomonas posidonica IVIA-Po-181]
MKGFHAVVSLEGQEGAFSNVQAALDAAPKDDSLYRIYITSGRYHERIGITRNNLEIIGSGCSEVVIYGAVCAGMLKEAGHIASTLGSRIIEIDAVNVTLKRLTVINQWDYIANALKSDQDPSKQQHTQAVALLINEHSDQVLLEEVCLDSYQDTFCAQGGRSYLKACKISGNIDFVFGSGCTLLESCELVCKSYPSQDKVLGYVAAPSTNKLQEYGLVFLRCSIYRENIDLYASSEEKTYALGRPWHPTKTFDDGRYADPDAIGVAMYIECELEGHIFGWDKMYGLARDGTKRYFEPDKHARFYEWRNTGSGALHSGYKGLWPKAECFSNLGQEFAQALRQDVLGDWALLFNFPSKSSRLNRPSSK